MNEKKRLQAQPNQQKDRVILHCDMNGFFASVELLSHPELRDRPMEIGRASCRERV